MFIFENTFSGYRNLYKIIELVKSYNKQSDSMKLTVYKNLADFC